MGVGVGVGVEVRATDAASPDGRAQQQTQINGCIGVLRVVCCMYCLMCVQCALYCLLCGVFT